MQTILISRSKHFIHSKLLSSIWNLICSLQTVRFGSDCSGTGITIKKLGKREAYGENEAIGARVGEVEEAKKMIGELGDGFMAWIEENPASLQSLCSLRLAQHFAVFEHQTKPQIGLHCRTNITQRQRIRRRRMRNGVLC